MSEIKVGALTNKDERRDAIHVAVVPIMAGEQLNPGQHVALDQQGRAVDYKNAKIGVVDPFLPEGTEVKEGDWFWLFLYPKTVSNLRHDWSHPAFITHPEYPVGFSEAWLRNYAENHRKTYEDLMAGVERFLADDTRGAVFDDDYQQIETPEEFWIHYKAVTGKSGSGELWGCCI